MASWMEYLFGGNRKMKCGTCKFYNAGTGAQGTCMNKNRPNQRNLRSLRLRSDRACMCYEEKKEETHGKQN